MEESKDLLTPTNFRKDQYVKLDHNKIQALPNGNLIHRSLQKKFGDATIFKVVNKVIAPEKVAEQSGHPEIIHVEAIIAPDSIMGKHASFTGAILSHTMHINQQI